MCIVLSMDVGGWLIHKLNYNMTPIDLLPLWNDFVVKISDFP